MEWMNLPELKARAEVAATKNESLVLPAIDVLGLIDAIECAEEEASVYRADESAADARADCAEREVADLAEELAELRSAMGTA